jgi:hypothetical protein
MMQSAIISFLSGSFAETSSAGIAEVLASLLERGGVNLAVLINDIDDRASSIGKLYDLLGAFMPAYLVALGLQFCDVDHGAIKLHVVGLSECLTAIYIDHCSCFGQVINDMLMP